MTNFSIENRTSAGKTLTLLHRTSTWPHSNGKRNRLAFPAATYFKGYVEQYFVIRFCFGYCLTKKELDENSWGELLVKSFNSPLPQQSESMLDRVTVFVEDLLSASGSHHRSRLS